RFCYPQEDGTPENRLVDRQSPPSQTRCIGQLDRLGKGQHPAQPASGCGPIDPPGTTRPSLWKFAHALSNDSTLKLKAYRIAPTENKWEIPLLSLWTPIRRFLCQAKRSPLSTSTPAYQQANRSALTPMPNGFGAILTPNNKLRKKVLQRCP